MNAQRDLRSPGERSLPRCARCGVLMLGFLLATAGTARAADQRLPLRQTMLLLFKALTFDENIARGRSELRVGVLSAAGDQAGAKRAREIVGEIGKVSSMKVRGLKLSGVHLTVADKKAAEALLASSRANLFYLGPGLKGAGFICQLAQERKLLVISGEPENAGACATITVVARDGKPAILLNREATKAQGAAFGDSFLKVVKVVK